MKVMNEVFLSFETREEYQAAVRVWKWNMGQLVNRIRANKYLIPSFAKKVAHPYEATDFFKIESLIDLADSQRRQISLAKTATQMLKMRQKMKRLAGQQMQERIEKENLVGV